MTASATVLHDRFVLPENAEARIGRFPKAWIMSNFEGSCKGLL
jgi:hypothetical protein